MTTSTTPKGPFTDEQIMGFGQMVARMFEMRVEGEDMIASAVEEGVLEEGDATAGEAAMEFEMRDCDTKFRLVLDRAKTAEEQALEGMPPGTEYFPGKDGEPGLLAIPETFDEDYD